MAIHAYLCSMKKLLKLYRRWRYRRLYRKLFLIYAQMDKLAYNARTNADEAFLYLTGEDYDDYRPHC